MRGEGRELIHERTLDGESSTGDLVIWEGVGREMMRNQKMRVWIGLLRGLPAPPVAGEGADGVG
jgi:hypothetical protein